MRRAFEEVASGQHTKQHVLRLVTDLGLRTRTGEPLSPQSFNQMLRKPVYAGMIESPEFGVSRRGDFEPLVTEALFYRAQGVARNIVPVVAPRLRNRPEFPLRNFVGCDSCGKPLTGSFSTGNGGRYAYYHCRLPCRVVNVSKARLEGAFVDELRRLQPTPGYMKLLKERVLQVWRDRKAEVHREAVEAKEQAEVIQKKLDRLDHAFIFRRVDRRGDVRAPARQAACRAHARADRPTCRGPRRTRRRGHPRVCRAAPTERRERVGTSVPRSEAAASDPLLPGRRAVRPKSA